MLVALAAGLSLGSFPAAAQTTLRGVTALGTGASDNARFRPSGRRLRSTNSTLNAALGLDLAHVTAGSGHQAIYALGATAYPSDLGANSLSQELSLTSTLSGQRASLELAVTGAYSVLNDITSPLESLPGLQGPDAQIEAAPLAQPRSLSLPDLGPQPEGLMRIAGGSAGQSFTYELTDRLGLFESADIQLFSTLIGDHVDPPIVTTSASLGLAYHWSRDTGRVELDTGYESAPELRFFDEIVPAGEGQLGRAVLGWARQLARNWRLDLSAGAWAARTALDLPFARGPAWRAALNWRHQRWRVATLADHGPEASVVLGGVFLSDRVTFKGRGNFGPEDRYSFLSSFRVQRLFALGEPPNRTGPATRWQAQVAMGMRPWPRRFVEFAISYRLSHQDGAILGKRNLRTVERNAVMLTVTTGLPMIGFERPE